MSQVLRRHIHDFGFTHAELARRAARINPATAYRVVEGETENPSLRSLTGIVEAAALTDADAGVLYRRVAGHVAVPSRHALPGITTFEQAAAHAKDSLDSGRIREAAYGVMAMSDLATTDLERADAYEQAGIVYLGLGRWEEAQVNFEAADAMLVVDVDDPAADRRLVNRKHTLMTNIGSLMVRRGNASWAVLFGRAVTSHPRATLNNQGWGHLVLGDAALALGDDAVPAFTRAVEAFRSFQERAQTDRDRASAEGNLRWARLHLLFAQGRAEALADLEAELATVDPEASAMAGLFHAQLLENEARRELKLRDLRARARRQGLGEVAQRAKALLGVVAVLFALAPALSISMDAASSSSEVPTLQRGNTGGGGSSATRR